MPTPDPRPPGPRLAALPAAALAFLPALAAAVLSALGGAAVVLGEADDSPGLQGLGGLLVLAVAAVLARHPERPRA
ncbi:hypothetical protein [Nocardioides perillae]|uniref:Uncharacterized protein n=1 Tax=Nocardioides perillae TaxID=1119534 RepID=A0A7Y9RWF5_9ACTN|nr:hypothetical protein [Nocardioides perillae]NYG55907.1 hypothetical protein [Nocardioides perillae]